MSCTTTRRGFVAWCAALGLWPRLRAQAPAPYAPSFLHPNDRWVMLQGGRDQLELWDIATGERLRRVTTRAAGSLGSDENSWSEFQTGGGRLWISAHSMHHSYAAQVDLDTAKTLDAHPYSEPSPETAQIKDSRIAALNGRQVLRAFFRRGGHLLQVLGKPGASTLAPEPLLVDEPLLIRAVSPSGRHALVERTQGTHQVHVMALPGGKTLASAPLSQGSLGQATFSSDGRVVWFMEDTTLREWHWPSSPGFKKRTRWVPQPHTIRGACGSHEVDLNQVCALQPGPSGSLWAAIQSQMGSTQSSLRLGHARIEAVGAWELHPRLPCADVNLALTRDGRTLVARYGAGTLRTYDVASGCMTRLLTTHMPHPHLLAWGSDPRHLLAGRPAGGAALWHREGPVISMKGSTGCPETLHRPPVRYLENPASVAWKEGRWTTPFPIWNLDAWRLRLSESPSVRCLAWSGPRIAAGHDSGLIVVHPAGPVLKTPDWKALATDRGDQGPWVHPLAVLADPGPSVRALAFLGPAGLVSLNADGRATLWDLAKPAPTHRWEAHPQRANTVVASAQAGRIVTGGWDGVTVWDATGSKHRHLDTDGHEVCGLALSTDGNRLAAACLNGWVWVWDLPEGTLRWKTEAHGGWASAVAFHPDGTCLASGGEDGLVCFWSPEDGQQRSKGRAYGFSLAWSPDGRQLAAAGMDRVRILTAELKYQDETANRLFLDWADEYT